MNFQFRIRSDVSFDDLIYIKNYIESAGSAFVFQHIIPGNNHYHIYCFGLDRKPDSIRKTFSKHLPKQNYSVSITAGKQKTRIEPRFAWQYGTTKDLIAPILVKGFSDEEVDMFKLSAERFYHPLESLDKLLSNQSPITAIQQVLKTDRVWERLRDHREDYQDLTVKAIKSKIAAAWLNDGKAMPRPSDLHRYAVSLFYLNKFKDSWVPDEAMIGEFESK